MLGIVQKAVYQKRQYLAEFSSVSLSRREDGLYNIAWELNESDKEAYVHKTCGKKMIYAGHTNLKMQDIVNQYVDREYLERETFKTSENADHFVKRHRNGRIDDVMRTHVFICLAGAAIMEGLRKQFESKGVPLPRTTLLDRLNEIHDGWIFKGEKRDKRVLEKLDHDHLALWQIAESIALKGNVPDAEDMYEKSLN